MIDLTERLAELQARQNELNAERDAMKAEAVAECRRIIELFGLTATDLHLIVDSGFSRKTRISRPAKYQDPESGKTWTGQGRQPNWFSSALAKGMRPDELKITIPD